MFFTNGFEICHWTLFGVDTLYNNSIAHFVKRVRNKQLNDDKVPKMKIKISS